VNMSSKLCSQAQNLVIPHCKKFLRCTTNLQVITLFTPVNGGITFKFVVHRRNFLQCGMIKFCDCEIKFCVQNIYEIPVKTIK